MATELQGLDVSLKAAADLSALQFRIMKISAARTINKATAATDLFAGVLQDKPAAAGRAATLRVAGISKIECGATVTVGAMLTSDSVGRCIDIASGSGETDHHIGIALEAGADAGVFIPVLLMIGAKQAE